VGLQKRGLRGLMEGRRLRERGGRPLTADDASGGTSALLPSAGSGSAGGQSASGPGSNVRLGLGIS
jgi:hypothetical protein